MVYDRSSATTRRTFRGVAFVDVADEASFETALKHCHKSLLVLGSSSRCSNKRKINVRPVRTKQELAEIVQHTKQKVAETIRTEKAKKRSREQCTDHVRDKSGSKARKKKQQDNKDIDKHSQRKHTDHFSNRKADGNSESNSKTRTTKNYVGVLHKLTKQQRNRRAAILLARRKSS
jgi:hypothetical protein